MLNNTALNRELKLAAAANAVKSAIAGGSQPEIQYRDSETYSENVLGPINFTLSNLRIGGTSTAPASPSNSPYIIAADETFAISVDVSFNKTPLSSLLMCLGTKIDIDFAFEGYGKAATEVDLSAEIVTVKGQYDYTVTFIGKPNEVGLTSGLYQIAAVANIGPVVGSECKTPVFGHGYIQEVLLEVYPAGEEII